jgi:hypothetical protein
MAGPAFVPPKWRKPAPLGYGNAIDSVGAAGSSLLAGFSLASVIVVTSEAGEFRWPGAAILMLTTAAVLLIAAVQCTYNTREFLWSGADVRNWWPELQDNSELETRLREEQAEAFGRWQFWVRWAFTARHLAGVSRGQWDGDQVPDLAQTYDSGAVHDRADDKPRQDPA